MESGVITTLSSRQQSLHRCDAFPFFPSPRIQFDYVFVFTQVVWVWHDCLPAGFTFCRTRLFTAVHCIVKSERCRDNVCELQDVCVPLGHRRGYTIWRPSSHVPFTLLAGSPLFHYGFLRDFQSLYCVVPIKLVLRQPTTLDEFEVFFSRVELTQWHGAHETTGLTCVTMREVLGIKESEEFPCVEPGREWRWLTSPALIRKVDDLQPRRLGKLHSLYTLVGTR